METEFIDDPIVPLRLTVPDFEGGTRAVFTLYHPGWYGIEDEESQAFIGVPGEAVYGFDSLARLAGYVGSGDIDGLAPGPDLDAVRKWNAADYGDRLCDYDLVRMPELADGDLSADEQAALGSTLALGLDLLDFLEIDHEHADALREDDDVSKLASGDELLSVFAAGRHRDHVVELLAEHWQWCVEATAHRIAVPN